MPEQLKTAFPDIVPITRPLVEDIKIRDINWLIGFASAEGCFLVGLRKSSSYSAGYQVYLTFIITQHIRDEQLMNSLIEYLGCGNINKKKEVFEYQVSKHSDLTEKIIPLFNKYPIIGQKYEDFKDFEKVAILMENRIHLTQTGVDEIRSIKVNMNKGRELN